MAEGLVDLAEAAFFVGGTDPVARTSAGFYPVISQENDPSFSLAMVIVSPILSGPTPGGVPVQVSAVCGKAHHVAGLNKAGRRFHENHRLLRNLIVKLMRMFRIVAADTEDAPLRRMAIDHIISLQRYRSMR